MNFLKKLLKNFLVNCSNAYVLHSDKELINLYVNNDDECAFDVLLDRYLERIYSLVFRVTKDHQSTEDVVQEIFGYMEATCSKRTIWISNWICSAKGSSGSRS